MKKQISKRYSIDKFALIILNLCQKGFPISLFLWSRIFALVFSHKHYISAQTLYISAEKRKNYYVKFSFQLDFMFFMLFRIEKNINGIY